MAVPRYPKKHDTNLTTENGAVPLPKNIFRKQQGHVFSSKLEEQHALEQFFWTKDTVDRLMKACNYIYEEKTCCFTTPSLAHSWHQSGSDETLLDIDTRFNYLPKFQYYDARDPQQLDQTFRLLILDPPFFIVPIEQIRDAVDVITGKDYSTKIIIAFLIRAEKRLRTAFREYNLVPTTFQLQYASIKPNKWKNFALYSNIDLPGIKRKKE